MRIDPFIIAPLGEQLSAICDELPGPLGDILCGLDPQLPKVQP